MARNTTSPYAREQKIVFALGGLIMVLFGAYMYFVSASVVHVIVRKEVDREISQMSSHISDLETRYIEAKQAFNEEHIAALGFTVAAPEKIYIMKVPSSLVLATENEI